jgi:hypothetical protein
MAMPSSPVGRRQPPQRLITFMNPLVRGLLASPLHGPFDPALLTLHVRGRRTGRRFDIPVGYVDLDGRLLVVTTHGWRANVRGGCEVEVTHGGRRRRMHAELDEDPASVAATLRLITERAGWHVTRRLTGMVTDDDLPPTLADLESAARAYDLAVVALTEPGAGTSAGG